MVSSSKLVTPKDEGYIAPEKAGDGRDQSFDSIGRR